MVKQRLLGLQKRGGRTSFIVAMRLQTGALIMLLDVNLDDRVETVVSRSEVRTQEGRQMNRTF